jgi:hypothetical protein
MTVYSKRHDIIYCPLESLLFNLRFYRARVATETYKFTPITLMAWTMNAPVIAPLGKGILATRVLDLIL